MDLLIPLLTFVEVLVCLLLILIVLMQRPRQEGLGASFGEGVTSQVWGAQTTNVLQKGTGWLAGALFATTLLLAYMISQSNAAKEGDTLFKAKPAAEAPAAPAAPAPAAQPTSPGAEAPKAAVATPAPAPKVGEAPKAAAPAPKTDAPAKADEASKKAATPAPAAPVKVDDKAKAQAPAPSPTPAPAPAK